MASTGIFTLFSKDYFSDNFALPIADFRTHDFQPKHVEIPGETPATHPFNVEANGEAPWNQNAFLRITEVAYANHIARRHPPRSLIQT
jgi:hypothetical protein